MLTENNRIIASDKADQKPSWLAYPQWLTMEEPSINKIYADIAAAREYYVLFFMGANAQAQTSMSSDLFRKLDHVMSDVTNMYDYSPSALAFTKDQVDRLNRDWRLKLDGLTDHMGADDFDIYAQIEAGQPAKINGGSALQLMTGGTLQEDFLYKHPATMSMFLRFSTMTVMSMIRDRMMKLSADLQDVQLPNPN